MHRRELLIGLGAALAACKALRFRPNDPQQLDAHDLATIAAIADTFLPGDDGTAGAADVNALAILIDPSHGLLPYLAELVSDLDQWCLASKRLAFKGLSGADREIALEQRMGLRGKAIQSWYRPAYDGVLALTKLAFCDHVHGASFLAFPGASRGYAAGSAAGAYASRDQPWELARGKGSTIAIAGNGNVSRVTASAVIATSQPATARIYAPDGRHHQFDVRGPLADLELALARGPAAGRWRFEITAHSGVGRVELWSLRVRTELDDGA